MSITDLLDQKKNLESKIYGVVSGIVINNQDPEKMGRVKVKIPRISGDEESNWARIAAFMGGKDRGAYFLPEVEDEVLVAFEYGDINMPYIIGSLWNGKDKPPELNTDGKNNIRIIKSRSGHIIKLDDTENNEKIEIVDNTKKNMIIIEKNNNKISIISEKDIELSAPNGKVIINAKDIEVSSTASTKIQANSSMEAKAKGNMELNGAMLDIKANGNMNLNASGLMNIKGSLLNLN
ncbi:MAG: phage tail protein [ANME-2 cluster archaeon]|nr:MAG: phage tail protein [ANME-2 cluster archaeon]